MSSSSPKSNTCTMLGCTSRAAASASRRKRDDEARVLGQVLGQQLDRDVALQARVERELRRSTSRRRRGGGRAGSGRRRVVGHPVVLGATPPPPAVPPSASAVGVGVRRRGGRRCRRRRLRRRLGGVGVSVGVAVADGVAVGGRRRPCSPVDALVEVVEPVAQVWRSSCAVTARQLGHLASWPRRPRSARPRAVVRRTRAGRPRRPVLESRASDWGQVRVLVAAAGQRQGGQDQPERGWRRRAHPARPLGAIGRTAAARRASRAGGPPGSRPARPRCRTPRGATRPSRRRCRAPARRRAGRRRAAGPSLPGLISHSPAETSSVGRPRGASSPSRARPRAGGRTARRASGRSARRGSRVASRHSSAVSADSTYSQTGSRGRGVVEADALGVALRLEREQEVARLGGDRLLRPAGGQRGAAGEVLQREHARRRPGRGCRPGRWCSARAASATQASGSAP